MINYKNKYIKYKGKYLALKNKYNTNAIMVGGVQDCMNLKVTEAIALFERQYTHIRNPINELGACFFNNSTQWIEMFHETDRNNARHMLEELTQKYITFAQFEQELLETYRSAKLFIGEHQPLICMPVVDECKSASFMARLAYNLIGDDYRTIQPYRSALLSNDKHLVYFDDCTYSGSQLMRAIDDYTSYAHRYNNIIFHIIIPYMTDVAITRILNKFMRGTIIRCECRIIAIDTVELLSEISDNLHSYRYNNTFVKSHNNRHIIFATPIWSSSDIGTIITIELDMLKYQNARVMIHTRQRVVILSNDNVFERILWGAYMRTTLTPVVFNIRETRQDGNVDISDILRFGQPITITSFAHKLPDYLSSLATPIIACGLVISLGYLFEPPTDPSFPMIRKVRETWADNLNYAITSMILPPSHQYITELRSIWSQIMRKLQNPSYDIQSTTIHMRDIEICSDLLLPPYKMVTDEHYSNNTRCITVRDGLS